MKETKMTGEEIVISGISGLFPNTENTRDLIRNLYNKVDMVAESTDTTVKHAELPKHYGRIQGLEKFDAQFFRVTPVQADSFDPIGRKILEQAYSAIFDAGINPETLKGSTLGVFIGSSISDTATLNLYESLKEDGYVITGSSKTMLANRISYWIDGKGPSYGLDHACASSIACLEMAFQRMRAGECDAAIVGGCNHSIHPTLTINMKRAGLLCLDGKTKCFDKNGDGFVRSEAINLFFLQKARDAKRIYAEVYNINEKFMTNPDALFLPSRNPADVAELMENLYSEIDVSPDDVEYVEANATGFAEADANEVEAIAKVFAKNKPIKVGSVKSNMGHTQAVSGASSLTKLCFAYQQGKIPGNLHYNEPLSQITKEGRVQVVTENTKFGRGFTALNNFSINGANYHVLLKGHYKPKQLEKYQTSLPRLVLASGRNDSSVYKIFDILENNPIDVEQLALLNNIFKYNIPGHTGRGYTILEPGDISQVNKSLGKGFEYYSGTTRPVWFLYSGMGSQWAGMGTELMRIPIFAAAIQRCNDVLLPKGLDVHKIITENDGSMFDNILHSFVGITAVQIGLTDILKAVGLKPNNIIGHSAGEIACAYADECLSSEECILLSYYRGLVSLQTMLIKGKMAAIGLGHKEVRDLCPPEIDIACKNSATSTTISGPADAVEKFVEYLQSRSIFARVVASSNIAYHSRYIADAGPKLMAELKKVLKKPKERSQKWLSTCFLPDQWNNVISKTASPEYFTYNLLNTVHFEEAANMIPADAIVIEVAPHGLMQAIVKRSHSNCLNVALTKRGSEDNVVVLMNALGTLYQAGLSLNVDVLYPQIDFPVSTETPVISHFVSWEHSENWSTNNFDLIKRTKIFAKEFDVSIYDEEYDFIKQYKRNGINIFPESAILVKVWETAAMFKETKCEHLPIIFTNVNFHDNVRIQSEEVLRLRVHVQLGSNLFEVTHNDKLVTSGSIEFDFEDNQNHKAVSLNDSDITINTADIYKLLNMRGYGCEGKFQSLQSVNTERDGAVLKWENDWNFFLDALFQLSALSRDYDGVSVPKLITRLSINPIEHAKLKSVSNNQIVYGAKIFKDLHLCRSGGVVLKSIVLKDEPVLEHTVSDFQICTPHPQSLDLESNVQMVPFQQDCPKLDSVKLINNGKEYVWTEIGPVQDAIQVVYAGVSLNKQRSNKINKFGMDFSGITMKGQKIMGIIPDNNIKSLIEPNSEFLWPVPQCWTMEEAATVPLPYIQAYYCLTFIESLKRTDTVLITNGDTGIGQALISICSSYGCTIFTTVKNLRKKKLLLGMFSNLNEKYIECSNEDSFLHMVRNATHGVGCNLIINDSNGSLREAAMGCVGPMSTLLDICEVGMKNNETFGMAYTRHGRSYVSVCLSNILRKENYEEKKKLQSLLAEGIATGVVRPLTRVVYTPTNISRAFQLLSRDDYIGRVLINMRETDILKSSYDILPRIQLDARNIYMVVCEGSELSVELVEHLVSRGARRLLLHVDQHMMTGYFKLKYAAWKKYEVDIHFESGDLHKKSQAEKFIEVGLKLGKVGGIFVCNNLVKDPDNDSEENTATIVSTLDLASREIDTLSYFAVLTLTKQRSTTDAKYSNIEKCCFKRNKIGLPSLALRHAINGKNISQASLSTLFNVLDSSLKRNFISVISSDRLEESRPKPNPVLTGFGALFRQVDFDEYTANEPMICMKTQLNNENESELYMDPEEEHLMIVPGFDGFHQNMSAVSERLKIRAVTMQLELDYDESIDQIATRLVEIAKTRFHLKSKFYLMGYSFGVSVALKTAALLEKEGRSGIVFCLDSSPDAVKTQIHAYLGDLSEAELQNSLIQHIYSLFTGKKSPELNKTLETMENWTEKVETFIRIVKKSVSCTHEFLKSYVNVSYRRILLAKEYQPDFKLNSEVVLIKGAAHPKCMLSEDYGLSMFTNKPVKVFDIQADHENTPYDCRVSAIVNKMLDHQYLEEFKNKNLCQYYIETTV